MAEATYFHFLQKVQTDAGTYTACYSRDNECSLPGSKLVGAWSSLPFTANVKLELLSHMPSWHVREIVHVHVPPAHCTEHLTKLLTDKLRNVVLTDIN